MTKDEMKIYDLLIAKLGDKEVMNIDSMKDSNKIKWQNCMKVVGYKEIIREHLNGKTPEDIAQFLKVDYRQVKRIIYRFNIGDLRA